MRLEAKKHLEDVRHAAVLLERFSAGKCVDDYRGDPMLSSAIERQFEVIGEALNRLLKLEPSLEPRITDSRRIIDFRNVLIHAYDVVNEEVVWDILERKLPVLRKEVEKLLAMP
jgi:uncharacterized protein with HEPN domain